MANQPLPSLQERLLRLAQTLQFAWFVGHVMMLFATIRYGLYYVTMKSAYKWGRFHYRWAFIAALVTYGIVVYKGVRAKLRQGKPLSPLVMLADENVMYLVMALIWLTYRQVSLALLPYLVYSIFHIATYVRGSLLPAISPPSTTASPTPGSSSSSRVRPSGPVADMIGRFIKDHYDSSMTIVAVLELIVWFRIAFSAVLFTRGSWVLLLAYTFFLRVRFAQSGFVQSAVANLGARIDGVLANQSMDPRVRAAWVKTKEVLSMVVDRTDVTKYGGVKAEGEKKAM